MPLQLSTGLSGQGFAFAGGFPAASVPAAAGVPEGPRTIGQRGFGVTLGGGAGGPATAGLGSTAVGAAALAVLVFIWWSLPR
jgi:hypothetical protein